MSKILKTAAMCLAATSVVILFVLIAPDNQEEVATDYVAELYNTQYVLQDLVKTYEVTEDTGIFLSDGRKVDYCEYE